MSVVENDHRSEVAAEAAVDPAIQESISPDSSITAQTQALRTTAPEELQSGADTEGMQLLGGGVGLGSNLQSMAVAVMAASIGVIEEFDRLNPEQLPPDITYLKRDEAGRFSSLQRSDTSEQTYVQDDQRWAAGIVGMDPSNHNFLPTMRSLALDQGVSPNIFMKLVTQEQLAAAFEAWRQDPDLIAQHRGAQRSGIDTPQDLFDYIREELTYNQVAGSRILEQHWLGQGGASQQDNDHQFQGRPAQRQFRYVSLDLTQRYQFAIRNSNGDMLGQQEIVKDIPNLNLVLGQLQRMNNAQHPQGSVARLDQYREMEDVINTFNQGPGLEHNRSITATPVQARDPGLPRPRF